MRLFLFHSLFSSSLLILPSKRFEQEAALVHNVISVLSRSLDAARSLDNLSSIGYRMNSTSGELFMRPIYSTTCMLHGRPDCQYDMIRFMIIRSLAHIRIFFWSRVWEPRWLIRWRGSTILWSDRDGFSWQGPNLNFLLSKVQTRPLLNKYVFEKGGIVDERYSFGSKNLKQINHAF